jgi:hypothetical protein
MIPPIQMTEHEILLALDCKVFMRAPTEEILPLIDELMRRYALRNTPPTLDELLDDDPLVDYESIAPSDSPDSLNSPDKG